MARLGGLRWGRSRQPAKLLKLSYRRLPASFLGQLWFVSHSFCYVIGLVTDAVSCLEHSVEKAAPASSMCSMSKGHLPRFGALFAPATCMSFENEYADTLSQVETYAAGNGESPRLLLPPFGQLSAGF